LEKAIAGYKSETITRHGEAADARAKIVMLERDDKRIGNEIDEANEKHAADMKLKCCPFCKSDRKGWTVALERAHAHEIELKTVALKETKDALKKQRAALDKVAKALTAAREADEKAGKVEDQIQALVKQREKVRSDLAAGATVTADLTALEGMKPVTLTVAEWTQMRNAVSDGMHSVSDLELLQKQFVAATQAEAQSAKARSELERQRGRAAVFKAGVELIRVRQQKLVDRAINAILGTARRFTDGIMLGKLDYKDGELGYWAGATWVGHETFSGTETALAFAAFSVALAAESEIKLVMIDELGIADPATKRIIIERMVKLVVEGVISQFCGADSNERDYTAATVEAGGTLLNNGVTLHKV